jgi:hypothetical protein
MRNEESLLPATSQGDETLHNMHGITKKAFKKKPKDMTEHGSL